MSPHLAIVNAIRPFLATGIWAEKAHHTVKAGPRKIQAQRADKPGKPHLERKALPKRVLGVGIGLA
jgi:hypothetical protein